ncbi:MAG: class I SAM-dependent methyltransferase [Pirellulales bacterium]
MFASREYQLLDFGSGRKLERIGAYVIDRPTPAAGAGRPRTPALWESADAKFEREGSPRGRWTFRRQIAAAWPIPFGPMTLGLKFSDFGQVGLYPEQAPNWDWIADRVSAADETLRVLNLFGYTGGSTLAAAAAGAEVTHVDAAQSVVAWARRNVATSGMESAPIRWIAEDAPTFMRRELRRGRDYHAIILDPPAYGHGPDGERWKLADQLGELLQLCLELTARDRRFLLLTCHSGELAVAEGLLKAALTSAPKFREGGKIEASDMFLASAAGGRLHCGAVVRWLPANATGRAAATGRGAEHRPAGKP